MSEDELREALARAAPVDPAVRERALRVVESAFAEARPQPRRARPSWPSVLVAAALLALAGVGAATAAAPQAGVSRWVRDVLGVGPPGIEPTLVRIPGGGRLLATAGPDLWSISPDGSRRRLGRYSGAAWSPRGRFVIAWRSGMLTAIDPRGAVRWSLVRREPISSARWSPDDGFRIAYVAGGALRIVNGDGTGDRRYAPVHRRVAPAWRPDGHHVLAYVDRRRRIDVVLVDEGRRLWRSPPLGRVVQLAWSADGRRLAALAPRRLLVFDADGRRRARRDLPGAMTARAATWAPRGRRIAVVGDGPGSARSEVAISGGDAPARSLFSGPGRLGRPAWSPEGRRLLVSWPAADQWLFFHGRGLRRLTAVAGMTRQLPAGTGGGDFPWALDWCCRRPQ